MDLADLTAFLLYINLVMIPIRRLTNFAQQFEEAMAGFGRFSEIMEQQPDITDRPDAIELKRINGEVEFRNVTFSYNKREKVLNNINIKIKKGQTHWWNRPGGRQPFAI